MKDMMLIVVINEETIKDVRKAKLAMERRDAGKITTDSGYMYGGAHSQ